MKKKTKEPPFKMVKVYTSEATPEQLKQWQEEEKELEWQRISTHARCFQSHNPMQMGIGALAEFESMFPNEKMLAEDGDWILVKQSPNTEYTIPPLSIWYATRWPMESRRTVHRVKVITPRGDLGLFPHEYSKLEDIGKYYEFIGDGMEIHFFGSDDGIPKDKLFYLRSRGIPKRDAIVMLLKEIRSPAVCWIETRKEIASTFVRTWPDESRLATK